MFTGTIYCLWLFKQKVVCLGGDDRHVYYLQRTLRHELFTPPAAGASVGQQSKKFQLRPVEYLLGTTSRLGRVIVLGMLIQLKEVRGFLLNDTCLWYRIV